MKKYIIPVLAVAVIASVGMFAGTAEAGTSNLSGWAWSSTIGWVSFNSNNPGSAGGNYAITVSTTTGSEIGVFGGYGWSSKKNIGWVSFNGADVTTCGDGSPAQVNMTSGAVTGWARALAGGTAVSGGWDGCIEMSGNNHPSPSNTVLTIGGKSYGGGGVTYVTSGTDKGQFKGFAWGGVNVGWLSFDAAGQVDNPGPGPDPDPVCLECTPGGATESLTLEVNDPGTGFNNVAAILYADENGDASTQVQWTAGGISSAIQTSSAGWPGGTGQTVSAGGTSGSMSVSFSNETTSDVVKQLQLSYTVSGVTRYSNTVDVTIKPYSPTVNICTAPANSVPCSGSSTGDGQSELYGYGQCPASVGICQFQCKSPDYKLQNGVCSKSSVVPF